MSESEANLRKRCIVVGGSGVVGRAVCAELAAQGARVGLTYLTGVDIATCLVDALDGCCAEQLDLRAPETIGPALDRLAAQLGGIDALIYCAALGSTCEPARFDAIEDVGVAGWNALMAVNVAGAFFASQHLADRFDTKGGNIVFLGSIEGNKPVPAPAPYAASKAALRGLVTSLAKALGHRDLRVNLVVPGLLHEGISHTVPDDLRAEYLKHCALGRLGTPEEVAGMVAWIALENTYMTAQCVLVDGGL